MATMAARTRTITATLLLLALVLMTIIAAVTGIWVLTAIPIGFLFGFFLQKGDLCGASAMSEVLILRDGRKLFGIWVAVVVAMLAFAAGDLLDLVVLSPKPMLWSLYLIGGLVFGVGTVLAGGCVSGCLYKGATGNLNSIVALLAMPAGIALVEYGPLKPVFRSLKRLVIAGPDGAALDLPRFTGLPFWILAIGFGVITLGAVWNARRRRPAAGPSSRDSGPLLPRVLTQPWKPWIAGLAIGLLALPAYMSSAASGRNYPLGVTHGVLQTQILVSDSDLLYVFQPESSAKSSSAPKAAAPAAAGKTVVWWLVLVVGGLAGGAFTAGKFSGQARLLPKPPEQLLVAIPGGFLVGAGAALGTGCVVGNIMSGWALMSVGMVLFGAATMAGNLVTTYFYLMGGSLGIGSRSSAVAPTAVATSGSPRNPRQGRPE